MFCLPYYKAFKGKGKLFVRKEMGMNTTNTECIALWSLPPKEEPSPNVVYNKEGADSRQMCATKVRSSLLPPVFLGVRERQ